jgi:Fic family protein
MNLNKNTSYVLLHLLNGAMTATEVSIAMPEVDIRSIQRALLQLTELGIVTRSSRTNPTYRIAYDVLLSQSIPAKLLELTERPDSHFNFDLLTWLQDTPNDQTQVVLGDMLDLPALEQPAKMSSKELEYLTIELSWKSSALEGNTYTLLDTQLLLLEGIKAKNRTEFETQMVLNHKDAVAFIVANQDLFSGDIQFSSIEELHRIIAHNLGIEQGIRKKLVKITASNYTPLAVLQQLREQTEAILNILNKTPNPYNRALLALALIPYLQIFEDGNKRTGRMLANAILIATIGQGFSLRKSDARQLALAYLAFYEFNALRGLAHILQVELG